jgi:hypothetical protein
MGVDVGGTDVGVGGTGVGVGGTGVTVGGTGVGVGGSLRPQAANTPTTSMTVTVSMNKRFMVLQQMMRTDCLIPK